MMQRLSGDPLDFSELLESAVSSQCGATTIFVGRVRADGAGESRVQSLWYEAYEPLALRQLQTIEEETRTRFACEVVRIVHRTGEVAVGEASVAVAASAEHREQAFAACRFAVEQLKQHAAIWKRERYADGSTRWRDNTRS